MEEEVIYVVFSYTTEIELIIISISIDKDDDIHGRGLSVEKEISKNIIFDCQNNKDYMRVIPIDDVDSDCEEGISLSDINLNDIKLVNSKEIKDEDCDRSYSLKELVQDYTEIIKLTEIIKYLTFNTYVKKITYNGKLAKVELNMNIHKVLDAKPNCLHVKTDMAELKDDNIYLSVIYDKNGNITEDIKICGGYERTGLWKEGFSLSSLVSDYEDEHGPIE